MEKARQMKNTNVDEIIIEQQQIRIEQLLAEKTIIVKGLELFLKNWDLPKGAEEEINAIIAKASTK